ncbi:MAG: hypothetical protein U5J95_03790 [Balneolaceae bacterium]|nr:hypothetical protein [Balneolaceae bacterium]
MKEQVIASTHQDSQGENFELDELKEFYARPEKETICWYKNTILENHSLVLLKILKLLKMKVHLEIISSKLTYIAIQKI